MAYSDRDLLCALEDVQQRLDAGDELTIERYRAERDDDHPAAETIRRRFGGWCAAVQELQRFQKSRR